MSNNITVIIFLAKQVNIPIKSGNTKIGDTMTQTAGISKSLLKNESELRLRLSDSFDILYKKITVSGYDILAVMSDSMCNSLLVTQQILSPILGCSSLPEAADECAEYIDREVIAGADRMKTYTLDSAVENILSGLAVIFIDGSDCAVSVGVQGFARRGVGQAQTEVDERSSQEAFCECFKDNIALLRRRIRSDKLKAQLITAGRTSRTRLCLCYLSDRVPEENIKAVKAQIASSMPDTVLCSGNITELLDSRRFSFFSAVGTTERPDIACAKIAEGRIVIIIDGTPFAVIVPYLFSENFQTMDDYIFRPFYAGMARMIKYSAFLISVFLPSVYIAVCSFHHEILPVSMLYDIAVQESITPFPVMPETIFIHFVYEIVREAGLRMPKAVGNAVSIVGALVIGQAAVDAGLIAAPMLIVMALSAVSSFIVPTLYQSVAILRFIFMIIGGIFGFYGIITGFAALLITSSYTNVFSVPISAPVSPFSLRSMRDTFVRLNWRRLARRSFNIQELRR